MKSKKSQALSYEAIVAIFSLLGIAFFLFFTRGGYLQVANVYEFSQPEFSTGIDLNILRTLVEMNITNEEKKTYNLDPTQDYKLKDILILKPDDWDILYMTKKHEILDKLNAPIQGREIYLNVRTIKTSELTNTNNIYIESCIKQNNYYLMYSSPHETQMNSICTENEVVFVCSGSCDCPSSTSSQANTILWNTMTTGNPNTNNGGGAMP